MTDTCVQRIGAKEIAKCILLKNPAFSVKKHIKIMSMTRQFDKYIIYTYWYIPMSLHQLLFDKLNWKTFSLKWFHFMVCISKRRKSVVTLLKKWTLEHRIDHASAKFYIGTFRIPSITRVVSLQLSPSLAITDNTSRRYYLLVYN